ncbi:SEC-C domain-containing protein [Bradyrhizobium sp. BRP56]|uniref:SEC-C domain-containing protein n=1 Tax=Bradyrhizobium sp. BRP56 TaxID=2793819 RepID=UPI001CD76FF5|nr:SEC-C domain-containing protein [Bradyrhizobium sp. BRP56]MCA1399368.1 SEC-C domain-containing protein [Bradyrhizobium sp. BRP56]
MTLLLIASNARYGMMFADCRISGDDGILEDDHAKIAQLELANVRLLFAYTGLTYTLDHQFRTDHFLASAINEYLQPDVTAEHALQVIGARLTQIFQSSPAILALRPAHRRLTVYFVGFEGGQPLIGTLSNFENLDGTGERLRDTFWRRMIRPTVDAPIAMASGNINSVQIGDVDALRLLMRDEKPLHAVVAKATEILDAAAHDPRSKNTIGANVLYGLIMADEKQASRCEFVCNTGGQLTPVIPIIKPQQSIIAFKMALHSVEPTPPKQRPNERCSCGSGKKYKKCHGRDQRL